MDISLADRRAIEQANASFNLYRKLYDRILQLPFLVGCREKNIALSQAWWRITASFLFLTFCAQSMAAFGDAIAWYRMPKDTTLPRYVGTSPMALADLGFELIPFYCPLESPNNLQSIIIFIFVAYFVIRLIFHKDGVFIAQRYWHLIGSVYLLRWATVFWTSLPNPDPACWDTENTEISLFEAIKNTMDSFPPDACGNLIFSGHASVNHINFMLALKFNDIFFHKSLLFIPFVMSMIGHYSIIACRTHYTVDVVLGIMISWMVVELVFTYFPTVSWICNIEMVPHKKLTYVDVKEKDVILLPEENKTKHEYKIV